MFEEMMKFDGVSYLKNESIFESIWAGSITWFLSIFKVRNYALHSYLQLT